MRTHANWARFMMVTLLSVVLGGLLVLLVAQGTNQLPLSLLGLRVWHLPLFSYLVAGSLVLGAAASIPGWVRARQRQKAISERLTQLNAGHYQADVLVHQSASNLLIGPELTQSVEQLRQKMIRLQKEISQYSDTPVLVSGQTKEAILTAERHRLARELHDSVSQQLFAAMMLLAAVTEVAQAQPESNPLLPQLTTIQKVIAAAQAEMRALLLHLRPTELQGRTLKAGILSLLEELQTKITIEIHWQLDEVQLPHAEEDELFRITQELLANTLRHAEANHLEVYLKAGDPVVLKVVDDGVGFDQSVPRAAGQYGLANIEERAQAIGGRAKIISFVGQGTSVEVQVPGQGGQK